jgi:hypothetical protein
MTPPNVTLGLVYPVEMYKDGLYRCVHSNEEQLEYLKKGWSLDFEDGKERKDYKAWDAEPAKPTEAAKRGPGRPKMDPAA